MEQDSEKIEDLKRALIGVKDKKERPSYCLQLFRKNICPI